MVLNNKKPRIGFIGFGLMGKPMARNLLKAGYRVIGYNRSKKPLQDLQSNGLVIAANPREVAENSQIIILMLPSDIETQQIIFGPQGLQKGLKRDSIIIDMSTSNPVKVKKIVQSLAKKGINYLDAPVSRGRQAAIKGTLTIMVGGKKNIFQKSLPIFEVMGENIFYIGPLGSGLYIKTFNNFLFAMNMLASAQGLMILKKQGINLEKAIDVISISSGSNAALVDMIGKRLNIKHPQIGFYLKHMHKDLKIFNDIARTQNISQSLTPSTLKYYRQLIKKYSLKDVMYVFKHLNQL